MVNTLLQIQSFLASPLDQFGTDSDLFGLVDNVFTDSAPFSAYIEEMLGAAGFSEFESLVDCVSVLLAIGGNGLFDDEDSSESEWEDANNIISSVQSSIFTSNILGMVPGLETITSEASFAFLLSISMLISIALLGFALHNIRYLAVLYPTGTPTIMAPFIIIIELISYAARAVSLGMRLFANMFAGHSLVKILMSFAWLFLTSILPFTSIPVFALLLLIFMLECGIAYLQSYVFATLSGMYIEDVISLGH